MDVCKLFFCGQNFLVVYVIDQISSACFEPTRYCILIVSSSSGRSSYAHSGSVLSYSLNRAHLASESSALYIIGFGIVE